MPRSQPSCPGSQESASNKLRCDRSEGKAVARIAGQVLTVPAQRAGVAWEPAGVAVFVHEARGYPYFLQQYGQDTWNSALGDEVITVHDARVGAALGRAALDNGFFRAWLLYTSPSPRDS